MNTGNNFLFLDFFQHFLSNEVLTSKRPRQQHKTRLSTSPLKKKTKQILEDTQSDSDDDQRSGINLRSLSAPETNTQMSKSQRTDRELARRRLFK